MRVRRPRLAGPLLAALALTSAACATAPAPMGERPPTAGQPPDPSPRAPRVAPETAHPPGDPDDDLPQEATTVTRYAGPQAGELAPSLAPLTWYRGAPVPAGEPYVLFFWGTWCKPCKAALPTLMERCGARHLPIVAVSRDRPELLDGFFAGWTAPFPERVAIEAPPYAVHQAYEAWTVPRFVFVGADGHVERVLYGPRDLDAL